MFQLSQAEGKFNLLSPFCFTQTLNVLIVANSHWGGPCALLKSPVKMLIYSRNTLVDIPINKVYPYIQASRDPVKFTHFFFFFLIFWWCSYFNLKVYPFVYPLQNNPTKRGCPCLSTIYQHIKFIISSTLAIRYHFKKISQHNLCLFIYYLSQSHSLRSHRTSLTHL